MKRFWKHYKVNFKSVIYNIDQKNFGRYLKYRSEITYSGAVWYFAKEYLTKEQYRGLDLLEMEKLLTEHGLYQKLVSTEPLFSGIIRKSVHQDTKANLIRAYQKKIRKEHTKSQLPPLKEEKTMDLEQMSEQLFLDMIQAHGVKMSEESLLSDTKVNSHHEAET